MRILYNSKELTFKDPFGTLVPDQVCTLNIHIPSSVQATRVECLFSREDGRKVRCWYTTEDLWPKSF